MHALSFLSAAFFLLCPTQLRDSMCMHDSIGRVTSHNFVKRYEMNGRKPKATVLHDLHGTAHVTRLRKRRHEPVPTNGIGPAPSHFTPEQKEDWDFAVQNAPAGLLFACDRGALEVFIIARDHHRIANSMQSRMDSDNELKLLVTSTVRVDASGKRTGGGNIVPSPYLSIIASAAQRMLKAATELGFSPAARPRIASNIFDSTLGQVGQARSRQHEKTEQELDALIAARDLPN
jgi:phage terminase small subunit